MNALVRLADEGDRDNILFLLNYVFKNQQRSAKLRDAAYWHWKFCASPFGKSVLTIAEIDKEIVGVDNLWPWEFVFRGGIYKAFQPCDAAVHPKARGVGIFRKMRLFGLDTLKDYNPSFLFNFPNNKSIGTNKALGWFSMGKIPWMVKPINPLSIIKGLSGSEKVEPCYFDSVISPDITYLNSIRNENSDFDSFIKLNRKDGYFNWRYIRHPFRQYGMIRAEKGKSKAAAIYTINQRLTYREMFIVDYIGSTELVSDIIKEAISLAKNFNISLIVLMYNNALKMNHLWLLGFIKVRAKNMAVLAIDLTFKSVLKEYANWSMMACLHDSI